MAVSKLTAKILSVYVDSGNAVNLDSATLTHEMHVIGDFDFALAAETNQILFRWHTPKHVDVIDSISVFTVTDDNVFAVIIYTLGKVPIVRKVRLDESNHFIGVHIFPRLL
jgi:hypothetical protein